VAKRLGRGLWLNLDGLSDGVRQAVVQAEAQRLLLYARAPSSARRRPALRPHTAGERRSRDVMDAMAEHCDDALERRPLPFSEPGTARTVITTTKSVTRIPTRPSTALTRPSTGKTGVSELGVSEASSTSCNPAFARPAFARPPSIWDGGGKGGNGATLKDRIHQHLLGADGPSRDTSRLISGLVDGQDHVLKSTARMPTKISHSTAWHEIPNSRQARIIMSQVEHACGAGRAGRQERAEIDAMIKGRLEDDARAGMRERVNAQLQECNASDSDDDEGDEAPVLPGEDARHVFKPPPRNRHTTWPTPVPLHHLSHRRVFSARNPSSGGWNEDNTLAAHNTLAGNKPSLLLGATTSDGTCKLRPYSAPVRA
jgi:hypothetical protein